MTNHTNDPSFLGLLAHMGAPVVIGTALMLYGGNYPQKQEALRDHDVPGYALIKKTTAQLRCAELDDTTYSQDARCTGESFSYFLPSDSQHFPRRSPSDLERELSVFQDTFPRAAADDISIRVKESSTGAGIAIGGLTFLTFGQFVGIGLYAHRLRRREEFG